jgi:2-polyprenyl-6-methoxyphenol hydroxylase-like FAD-dependent oxidoreductase
VSGRTPTVMIVGGGFGGLAAAKALRKTPARVVLFGNHAQRQAIRLHTPGADPRADREAAATYIKWSQP